MKKLVILFFMAFALAVSANETKPEGTKKETKKEKTILNNEMKPIDGGNWIVRMVSEDEMHCYSGGQSDCPIFWFLNQR